MRLVLIRVTHGRGNQKPSINLWAKHQTFYYCRQNFFIFLTLPEENAGYWKPSKTPIDILKIFSQKYVTFVQIFIFKILVINFEECSLICSFLWYLFYLFVQRGNISVLKCRQFYGIVKVIAEKTTKNSVVFFEIIYWDIRA